MAQAINRKNFLKLAITLSAAGCGDDDDVANPGGPKQPTAGRGGNAGAGAGTNGGGTDSGGTSAGKSGGPGHDHIPANPATMFASFTALVDGSNPTATFALPIENAHSHNIVLTARQVAVLRGGGQVVGKMSSLTNGHRHTYTISCG